MRRRGNISNNSATVIVSGESNTIIGGVFLTINTPALLAAKFVTYPDKLTFPEEEIKNFKIVGYDIECTIDIPYETKTASFGLPAITYYKDLSGMCKLLGANTFQDSVIFESANFPGTEKTLDFIFRRDSKLILAYIPKVNPLGSSVFNNDVFTSANLANLKVVAEPNLATANSGSPDGDLIYVTDNGGTVFYAPQDSLVTPANPINDLNSTKTYSSGIALSWTAPLTTNPIKFYQIYIDGSFVHTTTSMSIILGGLNNSQGYSITVYSYDIYYNKSEVSNVINQQINGVDKWYVDALLAYYRLNNDLIDQKNGYNGTGTDITYAAGKIGNAASFNGSTSFINLGNLSVFQSTKITVGGWIKTSNAGSSYRGVIIKQQAFGLFLVDNVLASYSWGSAPGISSGEKNTGVNLADNQWHFIAITVDLQVVGGTKIYIDGNLVLTTSTAVNNQTKALVFGQGTDSGSLQNYAGLIDAPFIFPRILRHAEIIELFNIQNSGIDLM